MSPRGNCHQQTTLVARNLGTITDPQRKRKAGCTEVTFTTFGMPDLGVDIVKRVANSMKRQFTLVHIQPGNNTMHIRIPGHDSDHVTKVINDLFDALRNADAKVPAGMMSSPSPRQRPQRRLATGRRRR